jgi:hypothetical protein
MQAHHRPRTAHWLEPGGNPSTKPTTIWLRNGMHCEPIDLVRFELSLQRTPFGMGRKLVTNLAPAPRPQASQLSLGWNSTASLGELWGARPGGSLDNADRNYGRTFDGQLGGFGPRTRTASRRLGREKCRGNSGQSSPGPTAKWTAAWPGLTALMLFSSPKRPGTGRSEDRWASKSRRSPRLHRRTCAQEDVTAGGTSGAGCDGAFCGSRLRLFQADYLV